jgi:heptaprenyl diphosphate synthase
MGQARGGDHLRSKSSGSEIRKVRDRRNDLVEISFLGVSIAFAASLYVLENLIPFPLPAGRWGFSNSVVLYFATISLKQSIFVAAGKSILGSLLSGRILSPTFWMGFFGAISAAIVERALFKMKFGYVGASLAGSAMNNLVQVSIGAVIIKSRGIFSLLPFFLIFGSVSAIANAYIAKAYERVKEVKG